MSSSSALSSSNDKHRSEMDIINALDVRHVRVELVADHDSPARIDFDTNFEAFHMVSGRWRLGQHLPQAVDSVNPARNKKLRATHRLLLPVFHSLCRDDNLPILLLGREKLRASFELETLLYQRFLKLLTEYLLWPGYICQEQGTEH